VAIGKIFEWVIVLHNVASYLVKAMVEKVCIGHIVVLVLTDKVFTVAQAFQTFLVWS